jgi:hypothetical protein
MAGLHPTMTERKRPGRQVFLRPRPYPDTPEDTPDHLRCDPAADGPGYRAPKIALPTRTQVAPQAMAISKSADMPIETVARP